MRYCPKCGKQIADNAAFCDGCGAAQKHEPQTAEPSIPTPEAAAQPSPQTEASAAKPEAEPVGIDMSEHIGKTCPFCKTSIVDTDEIIVCPACAMAHHKSCWEENGGCTTFGCSGKEPGTVVCFNCGADIRPHETFCTKCGAPKPAPAAAVPTPAVQPRPTVCPSCGEALSEGQTFCAKCGQRIAPPAEALANQPLPAVLPTEKKKMSRGKLIALIASAVAVIALICGIAAHSAAQKKIESYKLDVQSFSKLCIDCGSDLEDLGNAVQTYWNKYVYSYGSSVYYNGHYISSVDDVVTYAFYDNYSTVQSIKNQWSTIQSAYNNLRDVPSGDSELNSLFNAVKDLYEDMGGLYDCVINVSGNYSSFKSAFSSCDSSVAGSINDLKDLLN